jgi:hypothetical protein
MEGRVVGFERALSAGMRACVEATERVPVSGHRCTNVGLYADCFIYSNYLRGIMGVHTAV